MHSNKIEEKKELPDQQSIHQQDSAKSKSMAAISDSQWLLRIRMTEGCAGAGTGTYIMQLGHATRVHWKQAKVDPCGGSKKVHARSIFQFFSWCVVPCWFLGSSLPTG